MGKYAKYTKKYNKEWEKEAIFKGWLQESTTKIGAFCKICKSELRAQKNDLKKHAGSDTHKKNLKKYSLSQCTPNQQTLSNLGVVTIKTVSIEMKEVELKLAVYTSMHLSIRGIDHLSDLINDIGELKKKIQLHRTKCSALIKNVISPALMAEIVRDMGVSPFSIIVDESTDVSVNKYMAICVRYFSYNTNVMRTEYLGMFEVIRATAQDLHAALRSFLDNSKLDYKKIIGLGTDGANNMVGEYNSLYSLLKNDIPALQLVRCVCHSIHLCSANAIEELPAHLDFLIRESYNWFAHSSLRKINYEAIYNLINDGAKPLKLNQPSKTRWLSRYECIEKILNQWLELKTHFEISSIEEKCYSARILANMYQDNINYLYLVFLKPIVKELQNTNLLFQSTNADVEIIYENLKSLIISVCCRILNSYYQNYCKEKNWSLQVLDSTLDNDLSYLKVSDIDFGYMFNNKLNELGNKISSDELLGIKQRCFNFMKCLAKQLIKRLPQNMTVLEKLKYFSPKFCLSQLRPKFQELPLEFETLENIENLECQWRNLLSIDWSIYFSDKVITNDTVKFWTCVLQYENGIKQRYFKELAECVLNILAMPVSNAVIERIFSIMNAIKTKPRNKINFAMLDSIVRIRSYYYNREMCCKNFIATQDMLNLFTSQMYLNVTNETQAQAAQGSSFATELDDVLEVIDSNL